MVVFLSILHGRYLSTYEEMHHFSEDTKISIKIDVPSLSVGFSSQNCLMHRDGTLFTCDEMRHRIWLEQLKIVLKDCVRSGSEICPMHANGTCCRRIPRNSKLSHPVALQLFGTVWWTATNIICLPLLAS